MSLPTESEMRERLAREISSLNADQVRQAIDLVRILKAGRRIFSESPALSAPYDLSSSCGGRDA